MDQAPRSRIPRPPGAALQPVNENEAVEPMKMGATASSRKRKGVSPVKPEAKRPAPAARGRPAAAGRGAGTAARAPAGGRGAAAAAAAGPATAAPAAEEASWEQVAAELGWSPEDCLGHKLVFKKREDAKVLKETLLQYIKRLRALGRHLLAEAGRSNEELGETQQALEAAQASQKETAEQLSSTAAELEATKAAGQVRAAELEQQLRVSQEAAAALQASLAEQRAATAATLQAQQRAEGEAAGLRGQLEASQRATADATQLHQHAQKYNSQLQEYNTKLQTDLQAANAQSRALQEEKNAWAEEVAGLRGSLAAAQAQLAAAQSGVAAADEARGSVAADASRLRGELEQATKQHLAARAEFVELQAELARYKECTGKSVESLEREKAERAVLESQTRAQAGMNCELQEELAALRASLAVAQAATERQAARAAEAEAARATTQEALTAAEEAVRDGERLRRKLHNTILELKGNIRVFCRVRPLALDNLATEALGNRPLIQFPPSAADSMSQGLDLAMPGPSQQPVSHRFSFDRVFGPAAQQEEVFEEISQLVQSALDGYKVCIFAYGQTGSGKTHTMVGAGDGPQAGVIPRAVRQLFESSSQLAEQGWAFEMKASMLEIHNEELRDLLGKGPPAGKKHQITHDPAAGSAVSFLTEVDCRQPGKVADLLARAARARSVGATAANEQSSRSHMVFAMHITGTHEASGQQIRGVLNLIDLAGSERLSKSLATGERLKETQAINKSLSALGDVIVALGNKEAHVPFRNSKLTYLLQPCLGGDAKTLMFVNVAPTGDAANESLCSLRFAAKVNATEIGTAHRNVK